MAVILDQRAQLLQSFGSIATSASSAATEGINKAVQTDSNSVNTALKLFGGFDRSEFENLNRSTPNLLVPAVRPPASYEGPAEYLKQLSSTTGLEELFAPSQDVFRQLQDPQFRMSDGLSRFSDHRITQALLQKGLIISNVPIPDDGKRLPQPDVALDAFRKLYKMENIVSKQIQLHDQLDFATVARSIGPSLARLPNGSPKLNQPLKGLPDVSTTPAHKEMVDLWEHALKGTPQTTGELLQMIDTWQAKIEQDINSLPPDTPDRVKNLCNKFQEALSQLESSAQNENPNMPPDSQHVYELRWIQLLWQNAGIFYQG